MALELVIFGTAVAAFEWLASHKGADTRDGNDWFSHA